MATYIIRALKFSIEAKIGDDFLIKDKNFMKRDESGLGIVDLEIKLKEK